MRTRFLVVAFCVFGALGGAFAPGCSSQGEGERCDKNNDNSDCESGLECVSVVTGTGTTGTQFRCCPNPRTSSSSAACRGETPLNDATTPNDTGAPDGADTGTDAQTQDSGQDAPADAPTDTGSDAADASG